MKITVFELHEIISIRGFGNSFGSRPTVSVSLTVSAGDGWFSGCELFNKLKKYVAIILIFINYSFLSRLVLVDW